MKTSYRTDLHLVREGKSTLEIALVSEQDLDAIEREGYCIVKQVIAPDQVRAVHAARKEWCALPPAVTPRQRLH